jgi:hypothetical protein
LGTSRARQPDGFRDPSRMRAHHRQSLTEIQAGIKLPPRAEQGRFSLRAVPPFERVQTLGSPDPSHDSCISAAAAAALAASVNWRRPGCIAHDRQRASSC